ncbi:tetratricopeptide repeat protein [Comamonas sp.]|uniref:tetratricopeptide repeat protein n=1 Tax=Comamonas sp. TaxID=34028 RepID=UPI0012C4681F|nr:tetratricopeptide repeat protein [Comamonas sp.]MPS92791.1 sel1 repeat family protein [Comamonas sp.]
MNYFERLTTYVKAIRGNSNAQFSIAKYMMENDDPDSKDRAITWFTNSANQGHSEACLYIAKHFIRSNDTDNAIKYLRLSIPSPTGIQESLLGQMLLNGFTAYIDQKRMDQSSGEPVSDLDNYIKSLYPQIEKTHRLCTSDKNAQENLEEALNLLNQGIEKNNPLALHALAIYTLEYKDGLTKPERNIALDWLHRAAEANFAPSLQVLAGMYENGLFGIKTDIGKGLDMRIKAAETGSKDAQYALGMLIYKGNGFEQNRKKGIVLMKMAAKQGHREAIDFLESIDSKI